MNEFDTKYRARLEKLETTLIADAIDTIQGSPQRFAYGINPMNAKPRKIIGRAVTVKITAAGMTKSKTHMCIRAIDAAQEGDVIVIDNGGRLDTNCWGGLTALAAKLKGVSGTVIDGACRDIEDYNECDYPVFARGRVISTGRGRLMEESTNEMIQFHGVQVRPGDVVVADESGVVFIPVEILDAVIGKAEELLAKEQAMVADLKAGMGMLDVDAKYSYEQMLHTK